MTLPLFSPDDLPEPPSPAQAAQSMPAGKPRLRVPIRDQIEMRWASLDDLLEADHPVRIVWAAVCTLDLKSWLGEIKAVEGHVGRDATDPRLLVALWVFATLKAIGSARELARLCEECLPYQWLCGGVSVNYHMLSDFRSPRGREVGRAAHADRRHLAGCRVGENGPSRSGRDERCVPAPARVRSVAAVGWRSVWKRRGNRSRRSSNWPRRMEQS